MCEPVTAAAMFMGAMSMMNSDKGGSPPKIQEPTAPPASSEAKTPDTSVLKKRIAGAGGDPTVLAGPEGVPNDKLLLGKATVLGS